MRRKRASEIFGPVDPDLKVIDGGTRRRRKKSPETEWEQAAGVICPECRRETLRLEDGLCPQCARAKENKREEDQEDSAMKRHYLRNLRAGTQDLRRMKEGQI